MASTTADPVITEVLKREGNNDVILYMGAPSIIKALADARQCDVQSARASEVVEKTATQETTGKLAGLRRDVERVELQLAKRTDDLNTCNLVAERAHDAAIKRQAERDGKDQELIIKALTAELNAKLGKGK